MSQSTVTIVAVGVAPQVAIGVVDTTPPVEIGSPLQSESVVIRQVEAGATGAAGVGIGTRTLVASEALQAGDLVNVWDDAGVPKLRLACALVKGKDASGWVAAGVASGATATLNFGGVNVSASGLTPGPLWLSTTPGKAQSVAPSGPGQVVQKVGFAYSSTEFMFQPQVPITLSN